MSSKTLGIHNDSRTRSKIYLFNSHCGPVLHTLCFSMYETLICVSRSSEHGTSTEYANESFTPLFYTVSETALITIVT